MPNRALLKIGDKIRLLCVPEGDLAQRKREIANQQEEAGWTANILELIIAQHPVVEIDMIDEYGWPWFSCDVMVNGNEEHHALAITEDESWELA